MRKDVVLALLSEVEDMADRLVRVDLDPRVDEGRAADSFRRDVVPAGLVENHHHEGRRRRTLLAVALDRHPVDVGATEEQSLYDQVRR